MTSKSTAGRARQRRGRAARRQGRTTWHQDVVEPLLHRLPYTEILSDEGIERIHRASMRLLRDHGMLLIEYPSALETFRQHGATVDGETVKLDEETLMHFVNKAPESFTQIARNPAHNVRLGGKNTIFAPVYGPPFVSDRDRGRRPSTLDDFQNLAKLTQMIPELHHAGGVLVEPNDIPVAERHLDMLMAHITIGDKPFMGSVTHPDNARDTVTMSEILFGVDAIRNDPASLSIISISSPLRMDQRMLSALEVYARANQAVILASFIIVGAMSPTTLAATIAQQNAESLFAICYAQMLNPGTPCIQGPFLPTIDMKTGAPCFGTPGSALSLLACAQLARHYRLPFRSGGNYTASRVPDAQSGYESAASIWPTIQAGTNFVLHAAGWLEGGLTTGYEKFILDAEMLGIMSKFVQGLTLENEDFAWDAYEEAAPGQHFLGTAHTLRNFEKALFQHQVFNMDSYEKWEEEGSEDTYAKANKIWKKILSDYQAPSIDGAVREELEQFVAHRRSEIRSGTPRTDWEPTRGPKQ